MQKKTFILLPQHEVKAPRSETELKKVQAVSNALQNLNISIEENNDLVEKMLDLLTQAEHDFYLKGFEMASQIFNKD